MKESIGATQIFMIVITLGILFSGIVAFSINRSNAFTVKEELVSIIEEAGSFNIEAEIYGIKKDATLQKMVDVLSNTGYRQSGNCSAYEQGTLSGGSRIIEVSGYQRNGQKVSGNNSAAFCVVKIKGNQNRDDETYYYQVIVFYSLDIPVINTLLHFKEVGETKIVYN